MRKLSNDELGRLSIPEFKKAPKFPFVLVLDNIRSMNNTGSVFRTADAFRIEELILCGITACPPHREIQKTALDATESVNWRYFDQTAEAIAYLKGKNYKVYAIEQTDISVDLRNFFPEQNQKTAAILGNEIHGVDEKILSLTDGCIEIPQFGTKHSLNVAVSAGILLWDWYVKSVFSP